MQLQETSAASIKHDRFDGVLEPGDLVQIFSNFAKAYTNGRIADISGADRVLVEYYTGEQYCRKRVPLSSEVIKPHEPYPDKWNSIGWRKRCDIEAKTSAEDADFIISFATGNKRENERCLWRLQTKGATSSLWGDELETVTFCTDRSLGTGCHYVGPELENNYTGRTDIKYDYLGAPGTQKPEETGGFPGWFNIYSTAATETKYGVLILNLTPEYLRSKACRWEFGYIPTDKLFVYIARCNSIVPLIKLKDDAELILTAFRGSALNCATTDLGSDEVDEALAEHISELAAIVDDDDGINSESWCALPLYEILYTFASDRWGHEDARAMEAMTCVAKAHIDTGKPDVSRHIMEELLTLQENHCGRDHISVAITLANLGIAYGNLGDAKKEKQFLKRALRIKERHYGRDHLQVAITLGILGNAYGNFGNSEKKKQLLERALEIDERHHGRDHLQVAITLANLGNAYGDLGDVEQKKQLLERALQIKERHYGRDHLQVAITLANLGNAYGDLGDVSKWRRR
eukprot:TRINITY_DN8264_c0_g1_i6.p1 TRINITY_DN8264_c0_g1~~TRINITY_DN8264_c0_g1_i6.p1  ORF type:complete len:519 (-),score=78.56 TRINITY_DN8264_c0_g1_i6:313-1869(-)